MEPPPPPTLPPQAPPKPPPHSPPVASFFAIGDWGYLDEWRPEHIRATTDHKFYKDWREEGQICTPQCQYILADAMAAEARRLTQTEMPVKFVVNAGDNFYPAGVSGVHDQVWEKEWGRVYSALPAGVTWYGVYGNHDYGQFNRQCCCDVSDAGDGPGSTDGTRSCAQVQKHGHSHGGQRWYMPKMSYHASPLPGVNIEIVALDINTIDSGRSCPWVVCGKVTCSATEETEGCNMAMCTSTIKRRGEAAARLLKSRVEAAEQTDTQLIVVTHYPTTWISRTRIAGISLMSVMSNPRVHILYFGAHVHSTDNMTHVDHSARRPGWNDFCVGGGGGWACDGPQGFVVGEVQADGKVANLRIKTMANHECCVANPNRHG